MLEPELLLCIRRHTYKMLLAGDPAQLSATVKSKKANQAGLGRSLFERLWLSCDRSSMLKTQYRMHSAISHWPNDQFYQGNLKNGPLTDCPRREANVIRHDAPVNNRWPVFAVINTALMNSECEEKQVGNSYANPGEGVLVAALYRDLAKMAQPGMTAGIITPYSAQVNFLKKLLKDVPGCEHITNVVSSVDSFQGGETDAVIFSAVRSNPDSRVGFLSDFRRINVAVTRARHRLWIVGNVRCLRTDITWMEMINHAMTQRVIIDAATIVASPTFRELPCAEEVFGLEV
eukprot:GHVU01212923.1.p1 GENE.GHVU01212923.1~~GHVU01212923.1.p1  ORF type:complete len:289 (+),score=67.24 GHVU01212923.1:1999-2865(+)